MKLLYVKPRLHYSDRQLMPPQPMTEKNEYKWQDRILLIKNRSICTEYCGQIFAVFQGANYEI